MIAICPKNKRHNHFVATAHVTQDWEVNNKGDFQLEIKSCVEVLHFPDADDIWTRKTCGAQAIISK